MGEQWQKESRLKPLARSGLQITDKFSAPFAPLVRQEVWLI